MADDQRVDSDETHFHPLKATLYPSVDDTLAKLTRIDLPAYVISPCLLRHASCSFLLASKPCADCDRDPIQPGHRRCHGIRPAAGAISRPWVHPTEQYHELIPPTRSDVRHWPVGAGIFYMGCWRLLSTAKSTRSASGLLLGYPQKKLARLSEHIPSYSLPQSH